MVIGTDVKAAVYQLSNQVANTCELVTMWIFENAQCHYRLRGSIGFLNVQKKSKSFSLMEFPNVTILHFL